MTDVLLPLLRLLSDGEFHSGEALARTLGLKRVVVAAGVGVREYYRKLGYARLGPYMAKDV